MTTDEREQIARDLHLARKDGPVNHTVLVAVLAGAIEDKETCWEQVKGYKWPVFVRAIRMLQWLKGKHPQGIGEYRAATRIIWKDWLWRAVRVSLTGTQARREAHT